MAEERLQKILARAGVTSRRKAESLISAGRVRVDGKVVTELGTKADPKKTTIELDGKKLEPEALCYGVLHKPRGMLTTLSDPEGRPTARDILKKVGVRVVPVGRLDFNTSGALLFTNDGDFAQAISHAKGRVPKVYAAKIQRPVDETILARWAQSIDIEGKRTRPAAVRILRREGDKTWLEVMIQEGKNRQVKRLGDHAGTPVLRLARLSHAGISAEGLRPGDFRLLTLDELKTLRAAYGVPKKIRGVLAEALRPRQAKASASREIPVKSRTSPSKVRPSARKFGEERQAASRSRATRAAAPSRATGSSPRARGSSPRRKTR